MGLCLKISARAGCQGLVASEGRVGFESRCHGVWQMLALVPLLEEAVLGMETEFTCTSTSVD